MPPNVTLAVVHRCLAEETRELVQRFALRAGTTSKVRAVPNFILGALGSVWPLARALREMTYGWETPLVVDDSRFQNAFGIGATPLDEAIDASLASVTAAGTGLRSISQYAS